MFLYNWRKKTFKLKKEKVSELVIVIDSQFPKALPFGFRNAEINELFRQMPELVSYTMPPLLPDKGAWFRHGYGVEKRRFEENLDAYLKYYPENEGRIKYLDLEKNYNIKLAYSFFLAETYVLLPFYEKHKIPFVFVLYPGGGFGLGNPGSDRMLRKIFESRFFRKIIVTKNITRNYLISSGLCKNIQIEMMNGIRQWQAEDIRPKRYYKKDKDTFDICFVAAKYSDRGFDKGYDVFIDVAKALSFIFDDVRFHVIGGFTENDIGVESIRKKITFYGYVRPDLLKNIYASMDISLSPNRASALYPGNFDGFPLNAEPGYSGVAMFAADELGQNEEFISGKDIEIIEFDVQDIVRRICFYRENPDALYRLAENGMRVLHGMYDTRNECAKRKALFEKLINIAV